ncbi:cell division protein FtsQ/DivIB [Nocardioides sp. CPCC 205120]|uniref:cell division protein FtsQ/DivIB n=1 Tax=Nocardioides sp. CPCC 205120 TaxID=3406462 RepID=UPI003B50441B
MSDTRLLFERRRWRRRWSAWRWVAVVGSVLAAAAALVWLVFFSSVLAVATVEVDGTRVLTVDEVRAVADVPEGRPLARVDLDAISRRVDALAAVSQVEVTRAWPDGVRIAVTEREVVAVVERGTSLRGVDADGVAFRSYDELPPDVPVVQLDPAAGDEAVREVARVVGAMPAQTAAQVATITAVTVDEITLELRDGAVVVWGSAEESAAKGEVLDVLLAQGLEVEEYDVSVPSRPTTR